MKTTTAPASSTHAFELAGLGKAPFRLVGSRKLQFQACQGAPIQCGGSCDFCGTGIMDAYIIQSADGRTFKVGCDCVRRTGDRGLIKRVDEARRASDRAKRADKASEERAALEACLASPSVREVLSALPHPKAWRRDLGETYLQHAEWMCANAGAKGRGETLRAVRRACEEKAIEGA